MTDLNGPWGLLSKNEARQYLRDRSLPDDFCERLEHFIEFGACSNCDGVEDMNIVMRSWEDEPSWCGDCVVTNDQGERADV